MRVQHCCSGIQVTATRCVGKGSGLFNNRHQHSFHSIQFVKSYCWMEAKLTEKLRHYGSLRGIVLDSAFRYIPKKVFDQNAVFHTLILLCASTVVAAIFSTTRRLTLFSLHPTCMTIGTVLFFAEGIVSYRNGTLLEILSPIMQKDKKSKVCDAAVLYVNDTCSL